MANTVLFSDESGKVSVTQLVPKVQRYNADQMVLAKFVRIQPELTKKKGNTIGVLRTSYPTTNLQPQTATGTQISAIGEIDSPQLISVSTAQTTVTAQEYASDALAFSHKFETMSEYGFMEAYGFTLSDRLNQKKDNLIAYAMALNKTKYTPTGTVASPTGTFDTDGTVSTAATRDLMIFDIDQMVERARGTTKIKPFMDGLYCCVLSEGGMSRIRNDGAFIQIANYTDNGKRWTQWEVGQISSTKFFTENSSLRNTLSSGSSYKGEGFFFGADPCVEVLVEPDILKFGWLDAFERTRAVNMYWTGGYGIPWPVATAREERIFHITST